MPRGLRRFPDYTTVSETAIMFGIGIPELLVILVVALVFVGPERLPEVAKVLGKIFAEFRKAADDISEELSSARLMLEEEVRQAEREAREEKSPPDTDLPPEGRPAETILPPGGPSEGAPASVPRTKGNPELSSAPEKKESSAGESS